MRKKIIISIILLMVILNSYCYGRDVAMEKLEVISSAFKEGEMIPKRYSGYGENVSPDISWSKPPIGTRFIAIICDDPDAVIGIWTHWIVFNIPGKMRSLPEKLPIHEVINDGIMQGVNDSRRIGYDGPRPPFGTHRYYFKVYALDSRINIDPKVTREELLKAMEGNILAEGSLMGRYAK